MSNRNVSSKWQLHEKTHKDFPPYDLKKIFSQYSGAFKGFLKGVIHKIVKQIDGKNAQFKSRNLIFWMA